MIPRHLYVVQGFMASPPTRRQWTGVRISYASRLYNRYRPARIARVHGLSYMHCSSVLSSPARTETTPVASASLSPSKPGDNIIASSTQESRNEHRFSVAPMMDYTNRYQRYFMRLITRRAVLYTEMVTSMALTRNKDAEKLLRANFDKEEPLVLQLGGSCPKEMGEAAKIARLCGYREFNINVGCPSDKVAGSGCFGAALMRQPRLVGEIATSMSEVSGMPVSVKCRIGVNDEDSYEALAYFISTVHAVGGVTHFIVHARKAILDKKFTPEENRNIPPLVYPQVYRLCTDFPHLQFSINGGIHSYDDATEHFARGVHGVMVGRAAVQNPYYWAEVDSKIYNEAAGPTLSRRQVLEAYADYAEAADRAGDIRGRHIFLKPILNLYYNQTGGRAFRHRVGEIATKRDVSLAAGLRDILKSLPADE